MFSTTHTITAKGNIPKN